MQKEELLDYRPVNINNFVGDILINYWLNKLNYENDFSEKNDAKMFKLRVNCVCAHGDDQDNDQIMIKFPFKPA